MDNINISSFIDASYDLLHANKCLIETFNKKVTRQEKKDRQTEDLCALVQETALSGEVSREVRVKLLNVLENYWKNIAEIEKSD